METILAVAFGRVVDLQRGKVDKLTDACVTLFSAIQEEEGASPEFVAFMLSKLWIGWRERERERERSRSDETHLG